MSYSICKQAVSAAYALRQCPSRHICSEGFAAVSIPARWQARLSMCRVPAGRLCHLDNSEEHLRWRTEGDDADDSEEDEVDGMVMDAGDLDQEAEVLERYTAHTAQIWRSFARLICRKVALQLVWTALRICSSMVLQQKLLTNPCSC